MVLRKHLLNGIIVDIVQHETDRVIEFSISGKNEFNDVVIKKLMVEIMGRNSNVILIDDKTNASGETQAPTATARFCLARPIFTRLKAAGRIFYL